MTDPSSQAVALVCTLKSSPDKSSSELLAEQVLGALAPHDVDGEIVRIADYDVRPGGDRRRG